MVCTFTARTRNHNICMLVSLCRKCLCVRVVRVCVIRVYLFSFAFASVCVRVSRVPCVCLHIYRYIGTYIDRSKIAHASAHTSIYMHRFFYNMISLFFLFLILLFFSIVSYTYDNNSIFYMQKQKVLSQWDSIHSLIT